MPFLLQATVYTKCILWIVNSSMHKGKWSSIKIKRNNCFQRNISLLFVVVVFLLLPLNICGKKNETSIEWPSIPYACLGSSKTNRFWRLISRNLCDSLFLLVWCLHKYNKSIGDEWTDSTKEINISHLHQIRMRKRKIIVYVKMKKINCIMNDKFWDKLNFEFAQFLHKNFTYFKFSS